MTFSFLLGCAIFTITSVWMALIVVLVIWDQFFRSDLDKTIERIQLNGGHTTFKTKTNLIGFILWAVSGVFLFG